MGTALLTKVATEKNGVASYTGVVKEAMRFMIARYNDERKKKAEASFE